MKLGHLSIPKLEIEKFRYVNDIQTKLYLQYSDLIEKHEIGTNILNYLDSIDKVKDLENKMITNGSGSGSRIFDKKLLGMWLIWAINEYGKDVAIKYLNNFLTNSKIHTIKALWILGIETDEPIILTNNIKIMPITHMPVSREKEKFLKIEPQTYGGIMHQMPQTALIAESNIEKYDNFEDNHFEKNKDFWELSKILHETALILNLIEKTSCIEYYSTSYTPYAPFGIFSGSSGSSPIHDVIGHIVPSKITTEQTPKINNLINKFSKLNDKEKGRFTRIISRLSQAKRKMSLEDKILDLGIALEMALLEDNKNSHQLSLSFRLRGSWLIANNNEEKEYIYKKLRDIYNYRSQVAHTGILCGNNQEEIDKVQSNIEEYIQITEKIIQKLLLEGKPDWSKLILGII